MNDYDIDEFAEALEQEEKKRGYERDPWIIDWQEVEYWKRWKSSLR